MSTNPKGKGYRGFHFHFFPNSEFPNLLVMKVVKMADNASFNGVCSSHLPQTHTGLEYTHLCDEVVRKMYCYFVNTKECSSLSESIGRDSLGKAHGSSHLCHSIPKNRAYRFVLGRKLCIYCKINVLILKYMLLRKPELKQCLIIIYHATQKGSSKSHNMQFERMLLSSSFACCSNCVTCLSAQNGLFQFLMLLFLFTLIYVKELLITIPNSSGTFLVKNKQ